MSQNRSGPLARSLGRYLFLPLLVLLSIGSLLPLLETDAWWVRFLDFPRLQIAIALTAVLVLHVIAGGVWGKVSVAVVALSIAALGYHAYRLYPYAAPLKPMALGVEACPSGSRIRVMVANVQKTNRRETALFRTIAATEPDILLVMETNEWWDEQLAALRETFPFRIQDIPAKAPFFGMHLLSRYPLVRPEVKFYADADTPSIVAGVELPDGEVIRFIGSHPRPPQSHSQPTTLRDANLLAAAMESSASEQPTVLAGDFNAVPWERVSRRAMRIGGLLDPRAGRGLYPTYSTRSRVVSWPLDQVLYQDRFGLIEFRRLPDFGSDHYPVLADLCHLPHLASRQAAPAIEEGDLEETRTTIGAARALGD